MKTRKYIPSDLLGHVFEATFISHMRTIGACFYCKSNESLCLPNKRNNRRL